MEYPKNILYTKDHEWIRIENDVAYVGVTDFAQSELGDIVFVEIESSGEQLEQNEVFGTIEAVKTVSDLFLPLSGEVTEVNPKIDSSPEIVNDDPFGEGWLVKINVVNPKIELSDLLSDVEYKELIGLDE